MSEQKTCSACGIPKPLADYHKDKTKKHGVSSTCKPCAKSRSSDWYKANTERALKSCKDRYPQVREQRLKGMREWRERNPDRKQEIDRHWRTNNRDRKRENWREWKSKNPHKGAKESSLRRAAKRNATPSWANHDVIAELFLEAARLTKQTGIKYHVDHIVPLKSEIVCGLHWEGNMRVITGAENISKSNRYWPDMP